RSLRVPRVEGHQRLKRLQLRPQEGPLDGGQPTFDEGRGLVHLAHGQCRRRRGPQRLWGRCSVQFGMLKPDLPGGSMIARYVAAGELKRDGSTRQQVLTEVACELVCLLLPAVACKQVNAESRDLTARLTALGR